jgi:hypothetical protein
LNTPAFRPGESAIGFGEELDFGLGEPGGEPGLIGLYRILGVGRQHRFACFCAGGEQFRV